MELDLNSKQLLANLLAKPEMVTQAHAGMLNTLINKYPYYQTLHLLLAKANINEANNEQTLTKAALYNGGNLVYKIIHQPGSLTNTLATADIVYDEQEIIEEIYEIDAIDTIIERIELDEITEPESLENEEEVFEEIYELDSKDFETQKNTAQDEQEVFEEIAEIEPKAFTTAQPAKDHVYLAEDLVIENIVATDFFAFEERTNEDSDVKEAIVSNEVVQPEEYSLEAEAQTVSKYDDDKLPYTFLWWLAKTRKEHEQIFQPYVTQKEPAPLVAGELQQQYVEHIFHLQAPFNQITEHTLGPLNKKVNPKGIEIIDSFIKNDPQIKPPKAEKINTENKAKKSAEDHNDLVSETLAAIYIEQMLYHKAIDTYEKLSLKFPEKSRYFADLIQSLEKKI